MLEDISMFLTHRFGSVDTLDRARYWLTRHGFEVAHSNSAEHDETRLVMSLGLSEVSAALALIDSIERTDSQGWPGLFDPPKTLHSHRAHSHRHPEELASSTATTPIHWQGRHEHPSTDPHSCKVCEFMFSRSE
jgi:hypothetical protein